MNSLIQIYNLYRKISIYIKQKLIWKFGLQAKRLQFLESPIRSPRKDVERLAIYAEANEFKIPHLTHKGNIVTYSFQRRYIYEISNAIIDPMTGLIYDENGDLIPESSAWETTRLLSEIPIPTIAQPFKTMKGTYVFLPSTPTYYHWLIQDLPVFLGAQKISPDAKILTGMHNFKPLKAFLDKFFPNEFIRCTYPVRVEKLIMVAKDGGIGIPFPPIGSANPKDINVLQEWFEKYRETEPYFQDNEKIKIYLSRSRWSRANKGEILLEKTLEKEGFFIFHGDLDLFEQINLFSKANVIVGASGAAMSNMIWARPDTDVIQLHLPDIYWTFYYNIAHMCQHSYHFLEVPKKEWTEKDVVTIAKKINKIINN